LIKLRNDVLPGPEFDNEDVNDYSTAIDIEYFVATLPSMGPVLRASNHWLTYRRWKRLCHPKVVRM
jgi:hypothetical protein